MADKWTPGPWRISEVWRPAIAGTKHTGDRVDEHGNVFWGYSVSGSNEHGGDILPTLAAVHNFPEQIEANARLIAAAPDMAKALDTLIEVYDGGMNHPAVSLPLAIEVCRAALAKARGQS